MTNLGLEICYASYYAMLMQHGNMLIHDHDEERRVKVSTPGMPVYGKRIHGYRCRTKCTDFKYGS